MGKETMNIEEQAVILKGIASQILQMNMPTFEHLKKMLKIMKVEDWAVDPSYSEEVYERALLMCMLISNGCGKQTYQSFGDRIEQIKQYAKMFEHAHTAIAAMTGK